MRASQEPRRQSAIAEFKSSLSTNEYQECLTNFHTAAGAVLSREKESTILSGIRFLAYHWGGKGDSFEQFAVGRLVAADLSDRCSECLIYCLVMYCGYGTHEELFSQMSDDARYGELTRMAAFVCVKRNSRGSDLISNMDILVRRLEGFLDRLRNRGRSSIRGFDGPADGSDPAQSGPQPLA
jgi:hypothetical protein